jgi:hypothetical protein
VIFSRVIAGVVLAITLAFPAFAYDLPNPTLTPGAIDPNISQQNIHSTVCVKGYTKTVLPPAYYTNKIKKRHMREYGCTNMNPKHYEEDHLISLRVGGNPSDPMNLWPESRNSKWNIDNKDRFEFVIDRIVCDPKITLCGSSAHDVNNLALGIQQVCAWNDLSSYTWVWSCRLK